MKITDAQLRRIIHEELYRGSLINLGSSQGRRPFRGHQHLFERSYVTGVLGVHVPLNESYPYSPRLYEEIIREQFLFEGFWGELLQKGKDKLLDAKEGIKKFGKEAWAILTAFYEVIKGGAKEISSFTGAIAKKGINKLFEKIRNTLKWMVAKLPEWDMPTFSDWAQKGLDALDAIQENVNGLDGWKRVIGFAGLAVGLQWLWDKVGGWIDDLKEKVGDFGQALADDVIGPIKEWIKETAMEKLKEVGGDVFKKIMTTLASVTSGVKPWWDAAVKVAGGAKLVVDALGAAASRFMSRRNINVSGLTTEGNTNKGRIMKITKRQLRGIIKEALAQDASEAEIAVAVLPLVQAQDWTAAAQLLLSVFSYADLQVFLDDSELADELESAGVSYDDMRKIEDAAWPIEDKRMKAAIAGDPDVTWLKFLGNHWTSRIEPDDMKDIKWKEYKKYIRLSPPYSISHAVGEIHITNDDLSPSPGGHSPGTREEFVEFLTNRAGKTLKKRKIYRSPPPYYD